MKLGSFYRSTVETLIEALVLPVAPRSGRNWQNQAGEGIGIMGEVLWVFCLSHNSLDPP